MNIAMLEDNFHLADRMRECWRLWNLGFPVARPAGYRNGQVWYSECFTNDRMEIDTVQVFSFLIDLYRLQKMEIIGRYKGKKNPIAYLYYL